MAVVITGWRTTIAQRFRNMIPSWETAVRANALESDFPIGHHRYLFCQGLLRSKSIANQSDEEIGEGLEVNYNSIARQCKAILEHNRDARICIIGSESGYRGSFDENYAEAKRLVHEYVKVKRLKYPGQQLVAISPGIIEDAGMTTRREDKSILSARKNNHPMKRFINSMEVAAMAKTLLYEQPYVSGTVIRMHGGDV